MGSSLRPLIVIGLATAALAVPGRATAQNKLCVSSAFGVPGTGGTPQHWWESGTPFDLDDPRWTGASGHSIGDHGATVPVVDVRTTWAQEGGRDFLYASWQVNVVPTSPTTAHWLYLALVPPGADLTSPDARLLRIRFSPAASGTGGPVYCGDVAACPPATQPLVYQMFRRATAPDGTPMSTACAGVTGPRFELMAEADARLPWLAEDPTTAADEDDTLRVKLDGDRWGIQVRIPVDPAAASLGAGVREDTQLAYRVAVDLAGTGLTNHRWPRSSIADRELVCDLNEPDNPVVVDPDAVWLGMNLIGGGVIADPAPADCGQRLRIDSGDIGTRIGAPGTAIGRDFALTGANTVVARVHNSSGGSIAVGTLMAKFRIATWGAQVADTDKWEQLPVFDTSAMPPVMLPPEAKNTAAIADGTDQDLSLAWTLTPDQVCQFTFDQRAQAAWGDPAGTNCETCSTGLGATPEGARRRGSTACLPRRTRHQCMAVELSGGDVDFEQRSSYNNMDFAQLSVSERKALIDTAGLPTVPGQKKHDIVLVAMPRNMPRAVQGQTYEQLIAARAAELLTALAAPTRDDDRDVEEDPRFRSLRAPVLVRPLPGQLELPRVDDQVLQRYPLQVRPLARELSRLALLRDRQTGIRSAELVAALAASFDAATLGRLVPTLDIYAYYRSTPKGRALVPMTSFSLVTSHDGPLEGLIWVLDGAHRVDGNVYSLSIPVGGSREIGVRVQALEPGETPIVERPGGCCRQGQGASTTAALGGTAPLGLATILVLGRRRRKKQAASAKAST